MKLAIFIDCQNDFLKCGRLPYNYPKGDNFEKVVDLAKKCVKNGYTCIATMDTHEETQYDDQKSPVNGYLATLEGMKLPMEHCIVGSSGWNMDERLHRVLDGHCTYFRKPTFGSLDLVNHISECICEKDLEEIIICGYCTSICVLANSVLLRSAFPNTRIVVVESCCGDIRKETHEAAIVSMRMQNIEVVDSMTLSRDTKKIFSITITDPHTSGMSSVYLEAVSEDDLNNKLKKILGPNDKVMMVSEHQGLPDHKLNEWFV